MKLKISLFILLLWMACACSAKAGLIEEICSSIYAKLGSGPYKRLKKETRKFDYQGRHYTGCVIHLSTDIKKVRKDQNPEGLFGLPLPYCPDGRIPPDLPRELLNNDGWCSDRMADGPDGTSYTAIKENVFCTVEGRWDGGDDSDPGYVPSSQYEITVKCANR